MLKKLLLTLIPLPLIAAELPANVSEDALRTLLSPQIALHRDMAREAATTFGLVADKVEVCLLLSEGQCPRKHGSDKVIVHVMPQDVLLCPSLMRYQVYAEMYVQAHRFKHPLVAKKRFTAYLFQLARIFGTWGTSGLILYKGLGAHPALSVAGGLGISMAYAKLLEDPNIFSKMPQLTISEEKKVLTSIGALDKADTAIAQALIQKGHVDSVILELMRARTTAGILPKKYASFAQQLFQRSDLLEQILKLNGIADVEAAMQRIEQEYCDQIFMPNLRDTYQSDGPLGIAFLYRKIMREKAHGDAITPWGMRYSSCITHMQKFCEHSQINIQNMLKDLAHKEIQQLISAALKTTNPPLQLKKAKAQLKIFEQNGLDTELDNNAGIKDQIHTIEQWLAKHPAN